MTPKHVKIKYVPSEVIHVQRHRSVFCSLPHRFFFRTKNVGRTLCDGKREGVLICYENRRWELGDTVLGALQISHVASCMGEALTNFDRFACVAKVCHRIHSQSNNKQLLLRTMAVNSHRRSVEFLIQHNHIPDTRKTASIHPQLLDEARVVARCTCWMFSHPPALQNA